MVIRSVKLFLIILFFLSNSIGLFTSQSEFRVQFHSVDDCVNADDYWQLVDDTRISLIETNAINWHEKIETLIHRWKSTNNICSGDSSQTKFDKSFIISQLSLISSNDPNSEQRLRLVSFLEQLSNTKKIPQVNLPPHSSEILSEILSRSEFNWPSKPQNPLTKWINDRILQFLGWLDQLLGRNENIYSGPFGLFVRYALPFLAVMCIGMLGVYIYTNLHNAFRPAVALNLILQTEDEQLNSLTAFQKAELSAKNADYRNAVRYQYISLLLMLDEKDILRFDKTRTNREFIKSISLIEKNFKDKSITISIIAALTYIFDIFENTWYGYKQLSWDEYDTVTQKVVQIQHLLGSNTVSESKLPIFTHKKI